MFSSRFMPCTECGASVDRRADTAHTCDRDRLVDYRIFGLRRQIESLESGFTQFLETPTGRFERWLAARQVRRTA